MEIKHTKWEWIALATYATDKDGNEFICAVECNNRDIAIALGNNSEDVFYNAKLISAAPELLEACINALDKCCDLIGTEAGEALERAIQKATK